MPGNCNSRSHAKKRASETNKAGGKEQLVLVIVLTASPWSPLGCAASAWKYTKAPLHARTRKSSVIRQIKHGYASYYDR